MEKRDSDIHSFNALQFKLANGEYEGGGIKPRFEINFRVEQKLNFTLKISAKIVMHFEMAILVDGMVTLLCLKPSSYAILIELKSQGLDPKSAAAVNQNTVVKNQGLLSAHRTFSSHVSLSRSWVEISSY